MRVAGGWTIVSINGKKKGLYYLKEGYDTHFLKVHFGNSDGNFYDGGFLREIDQPLQLISTKNDVKSHADLKALFAAAHEPNHTKRFEKLENDTISFEVNEDFKSETVPLPPAPTKTKIGRDLGRDAARPLDRVLRSF